MKYITVITAPLLLVIVGCGNLPAERALSGSAIGAGTGAIVGAVTGVTVATGALLGAGAGALVGGLTSAEHLNFGEPAWKRGAGAPLSVIGTDPPITTQVINSIQTSLNRLGYDAGPVDGIYGVRTQRAIRAYQRDHELRESGRASPELADHLWSQGRPRPHALRPG
jgi:osmotically inducible lipoprotein OsmB